MRDYVYDLETYPNCFLATFLHVATGDVRTFEISDRCNQVKELAYFVRQLQQVNARGIGYNNLAFDYPVLHWVLGCPWLESITAGAIYNRVLEILRNQDDEGAFSSQVFPDQWIFEQVDLFKIHHFDNKAKHTSLKVLQFNMDSESLEDLPFPVGTTLTPAQMDDLRRYNVHDCTETMSFLLRSMDAIEFREQLSVKFGRNFMNHNDTKIGKDFFIMRLEQDNPGCCYTRDPETGRRVTRQTRRESIALADAIFPYVRFERDEFNRVLHYLRSQVIHETKGAFKDLTATVDGFNYVFGVGGIHGSIDPATVEASDTHAIIDVDVSSYYPSLAIENRLFPAHIGERFADIYADLRTERKKHKKGTVENAMLKLALNGTFGDSNNQYSPLYDPLLMLSITINGQLLLCMLAEQVVKIPGLSLVQINTDGMTVRCPREHVEHFRAVCDWWQQFTRLELEFADYSRMFVRDVNNYIAERTDGKVKRKGAYEYYGVSDGVTDGLQWHQNHSGRIIARAAEAALLDGEPVADYVLTWPIERDFYMLAKVPRSSRLVIVEGGRDREIQGTSRYYVSNSGGQLVKIMPPLKGKTTERRISIDAGWNATVINRRQPLRDVNYRYYVTEAEKLVTPVAGRVVR